MIQHGLQLAKRRLAELTGLGETIHRAVAGAGGDQRGDGCTAILRKIDRSLGPIDRLLRRDEWGLKQNKRSQIHLVPGDEVCGVAELVERYPLVEFFERHRVDGLEAERDLEPAAEPVAEP